MHCLNLKLTYECTNRCSFCFSSYLKDIVISEAGLMEAVEHGFQNGCRELVLSGGEPTLFPDSIIKIMKHAEELGYEKYIIQTNGSGLSEVNRLVLFLDEIAQRKEVCISFSVHGHCDAVHDEMSCRVGAFKNLLLAMKNMQSTSCKIYTNTVISSQNINILKEIGELCKSFDAEVIQFSMMHLETPNILSTGLLEAASAVRKVVDIVGKDTLKTEGIPYCLMYGIEQCVGESFWPNALDLYNKENDYMQDFSQLEDGMRWKSHSCRECIMNEICMGIWKEHKNEFVNAQIHPISR